MFTKGHIPWNKKPSILEENKKPIICECGCGQEIVLKEWHRWHGIPRFIKGHYSKTKIAKEKNKKVHTGKVMSEIAKAKIRNFQKDRKKSKVTKLKMSKYAKTHPNHHFVKGKASWNKDKEMSAEYCERCRQENLGRHPSKITKEKMSIAHRGEKARSWKGGITPLSERIRKLSEYKEWRLKIFIRDSFGCIACGSKYKIEAHHNKKEFSILLAEFLKEYNQFSPYEDKDTLVRLAMKWQPFWTAEGETLCKDCHKKTKSYLNNNVGGK